MGPELAVIGAFCLMLIACVIAGWPVLVALVAGFVLFCGYGLARGHELRVLLSRGAQGVRAAGTILVTFVLIGMLTALWRASGTIAFIVAEASQLVSAATVVQLTFLLCSGMSVLVGSSFASAATMGSICMSLGMSMGANPVLLGGAMLAGVFVGDRCSPVSTSALLVAQLTETTVAGNIRGMLRTAAVPFVASCVIYAVAGLALGGDAGSGEALDVAALFGQAFDLQWVAVLPAVFVMVLAALRVDVRATLLVGVASAAVVCAGVQGMDALDVARCALCGYESANAEVAALLDGGGVSSMLNVMAIILVSSSYAGVFEETHLLDGLCELVARVAAIFGPYAATALVAVATSAIACNQTLAIMLTHQLAGGLRDGEGAAEKAALDLEDSVVVIAPFIPWSIAGSVPLASAGAPAQGMVAACFLYLLPLWRLARGHRDGEPCSPWLPGDGIQNSDKFIRYK